MSERREFMEAMELHDQVHQAANHLVNTSFVRAIEAEGELGPVEMMMAFEIAASVWRRIARDVGIPMEAVKTIRATTAGSCGKHGYDEMKESWQGGMHLLSHLVGERQLTEDEKAEVSARVKDVLENIAHGVNEKNKDDKGRDSAD